MSKSRLLRETRIILNKAEDEAITLKSLLKAIYLITLLAFYDRQTHRA